jgi:DegV family protein with EDD domain
METKARRRIAVVTDSTAYIPPHLIQQHHIHVVPVILIMGNKQWRDGVDIDPPAFYELLRTSRDFPKTSQPNVSTFEELFTELSKTSDGIVVIVVTSKLSGTYDSATAAAANLPHIPIEVIDSQYVSMALGFPVIAAAKAAEAGGDLKTVAEAARALIRKCKLYFVLETLEYLHRGGRIGSAAWLLGSALDMKPILQLKDGVIKPVTKVRTRRKALEMLYQLLQEQLPAGGKVHMAVINVAAPQEAAQLKQQLEARFHPVELLEVECSPAIGAHAGPGTVGVAFYVE